MSFRAPGGVAVVEYEGRSPKPGEVRLRTLYSGISAGTELTAFRGSNPYVTKMRSPPRDEMMDAPPSMIPSYHRSYRTEQIQADSAPAASRIGAGHT